MPRPRLRVTAVIDQLRIGGAETLVSEFALVAASAGIELSVVALGMGPAQRPLRVLRERGIEPLVVGLGPRLTPRSFLQVRQALALQRPQLVHTHLGYPDLLGGVAAWSLRIPSVSTIHTTQWSTAGMTARARAVGRLSAFARRRCAARIIAVSEAGRQSYLQAGLAPPDHVTVLRNAIATQPEPGSGTAIRRELGLAPDDVVLATVSVLRREKGHDSALEAIRVHRSRFPRLRLVIVGDGEVRDDIARAAGPLGDRVMMAGFRDDVLPILDAVDVLVHPSHNDAFPTSLLEAMAAGVPVVATRVGGIPEIVVDGETGVLVDRPADLADGLLALLEDPARRRAMGERGRERFAREFTGIAWAARTRALYDEVLSRPRDMHARSI